MSQTIIFEGCESIVISPEEYDALVEALERADKLVRLLTVRQVVMAGDEACEAAGLNPWCMNEGAASGDEGIGAWFITAALAKAKGEKI